MCVRLLPPGALQPPRPFQLQELPLLQCSAAQCPHSLLVRDGLVAAVADPHFELEAHQGDGGALGAALPAHGFPALPAVMLHDTTGTKTSKATNPDQVPAQVCWLFHLTPARHDAAQLCPRHSFLKFHERLQHFYTPSVKVYHLQPSPARQENTAAFPNTA